MTHTTHTTSRISRGGLIALLIGLMMWLWVWLMVMLGLSTPVKTHINTEAINAVPTVDIQTAQTEELKRIRQAPLMLVFGMALILVFLLSSYILVRGSRRFIQNMDTEKQPPTNSSDVWSMHVLPDDRDPRRT